MLVCPHDGCLTGSDPLWTSFACSRELGSRPEYSCGASALQTVLSYWGSNNDEVDLMRLLNTNSDVGTYPEDIARGAISLGFKATAKERLTLDDVERFTAKGNPVIALAQVWRSHKNSATPVADEWDNGHYVVVLGVDKDYVYFQDPYVRMSKAFVPRKSFEEHWHHAMGGRDLVHLGIFIEGEKPARRRPASKLKPSKADFQELGSFNLIIAQFRGVLLPYDLMSELMDIWQRGDVRPDAFIFLRKDKDGNVSGIEGSHLHEEKDMAAVNVLISEIARRRLGSPRSARSSAELAISAVAKGDFGLSVGHIRKIAQKLPPDHSAVAVLVENVWEKKFKKTAKKYEGTVIDQRLITAEALADEASKLTPI